MGKHRMSTTAVREKRQTTLPLKVYKAANLQVNDQIEWRFEAGEIRGRKLVKEQPQRRIIARLIERDGKMIFDAGEKIFAQSIAKAVAEERHSR